MSLLSLRSLLVRGRPRATRTHFTIALSTFRHTYWEHGRHDGDILVLQERQHVQQRERERRAVGGLPRHPLPAPLQPYGRPPSPTPRRRPRVRPAALAEGQDPSAQGAHARGRGGIARTKDYVAAAAAFHHAAALDAAPGDRRSKPRLVPTLVA